MEVDCKATEIEHLQLKLNEAVFLSSKESDSIEDNVDFVFEGLLSIPNKQNIRRHGWKKQFVVVSSKRIIFYNNEADKQNTSDPVLIIDLRWILFFERECKRDINVCFVLIAKCFTWDRSHRVMWYVLMPKRFRESFNFCMLAKEKHDVRMSKLSTAKTIVQAHYTLKVGFCSVSLV